MQHSAFGALGEQPLGGAFPLVMQHWTPLQPIPKPGQQSAGTLQDDSSGLQQIPVLVQLCGGSQQS